MQGSRYNKSEHNGNFIVGGVVVRVNQSAR